MLSQDTGMPTLVNAALSYTARGWHVFPCRGKKPLTEHGFKDASTDPAVIQKWWERWDDANVAIATGSSGLVVVDIDRKDGVDGQDTWFDLRKELNLSEETVTCETPTGGLHLYYRADGHQLRNSAGKLGPGVDIRARGGYVIAPPSVHPEGGIYQWAMDMAPHEIEMLPVSEALVERLNRRSTSQPTAIGERIAEGQRNSTLASLAGTMRRRGASEEAIEAALLEENRRCVPPLDEREVRGIAHSIAGYEPLTQDYKPTDLGNAQRLVAHGGSDIRYCELLGGWLVWDGKRWASDTKGAVQRLAQEVARGIHVEASRCEDDERRKVLARWALRSESANRQRAMLDLAWSQPGVAVDPDVFDADPWLLNVENGIVDLRTGQLQPHRREALLTKLAPVAFDPDAEDPILAKYLQDATGGDEEFASYLQRAVGYTLTGVTDEEAFFLSLGPAATGKSTLVEAILAMLGDYGQKASFDTFLQQRNVGGARPDIAMMRGIRFVAAVETAATRHLAEPMIKELVGGDTVTARHLYRAPFSFKPECKLWLAANESPRMTDTDGGIWRRLRRLPFEHVVSKPDPEVKKHLCSPDGRQALLAWAVKGCLAWRGQRLGTCSRVSERTSELRIEMNPIGEFLVTRCLVAPTSEVIAKDLRDAYEEWAAEMGAKPINDREWGARLRNLGCQSSRRRRGGPPVTLWSGIGLLTADADPEGVQTVHPEQGLPVTFAISSTQGDFLEMGSCTARCAHFPSDHDGYYTDPTDRTDPVPEVAQASQPAAEGNSSTEAFLGGYHVDSSDPR